MTHEVLDVKRLVRAIRIVADAEPYFLEYTAELNRLANDVVAEYVRLAAAPPVEESSVAVTDPLAEGPGKHGSAA